MIGHKKEIDEVIKNHFRPVVCLIPDLEQICFTVLYSEGFLKAKVIKYLLHIAHILTVWLVISNFKMFN